MHGMKRVGDKWARAVLHDLDCVSLSRSLASVESPPSLIGVIIIDCYALVPSFLFTIGGHGGRLAVPLGQSGRLQNVPA